MPGRSHIENSQACISREEECHGGGERTQSVMKSPQEKGAETGCKIPQGGSNLSHCRSAGRPEAEAPAHAGQEKEDGRAPQDNKVEAKLSERVIIDERGSGRGRRNGTVAP